MTTASGPVSEGESERGRSPDLVETMPAYAWTADTQGKLIDISDATQAFLGVARTFLFSPEEDELGWPRTLHPDDYDATAARWQHCLRTGEPCDNEHRLRRSDGVYRWFRTSVRAVRDGEGRITRWHGLSVDIDDQKQVEAALRDREEELSQLVDMVPSHVWRLTPEGEPTFFNRRMVEFLGLDVADTVGQGRSRLSTMIERVIHPVDAATFGDTLHRCLVTGETFAARYRLRRADGDYRWMSSRAEPMRDHEGRIVHWYGLCHDIHDQMQAEEALRKSERRLQEMIDAVPVRIWSATATGEALYFNKRYQDHLRAIVADEGALERPSIDRFVRELVHPEDVAGVQGRLRTCFRAGAGAVLRFRWLEKDGAYRWAECRVEPRRDEEGAISQWYGVSIDIDDEIQAQEALRRASDRLARATQAAGLAELSASIAHEVNQPLAAIAANSEACQRWLAADPPNLERARITVGRITRDAHAVADIVGRIRALFRRTPGARSSEDVNRLIGQVCQLMAEEIAGRGVRVEADLAPDLAPVVLDRVQVQQVLVNLIRNGVEAMDAIVDAPRLLNIRSSDAGRGAVRIEVRDAGAGFADAGRAFEPFFTTKPEGMGMGLAICRSIVESHGGRLSVRNNEMRGATVAFTLASDTGEAGGPSAD